jgi:anhydro-N-acetylmuramic acid kinase
MIRALGTISGTSVDGIDLAVIETDGERLGGLGPAATLPYRPETRAAVLALIDAGGEAPAGRYAALGKLVTEDHATAIQQFLAAHGIAPRDLALVAFHGQTVLHRPERRLTVQLGDPQVLADGLGLPVVGDLRQADIAAGGQGAPIVPVYHAALARDLTPPVCFLNIGGVANLTWIDGDRLIAFDVGPGNAPLDDWLRRHTGAPFDRDGVVASAGRPDETRIATALTHPFFAAPWPKSLDRNAFPRDLADGLSLADGAATLVGFAAAAVARAAALLPAPPRLWLVCGGGRRNPALMAALSRRLAAPVEPVETLGHDGDAIEAQAMAFLGVRTLRGLAATFPTTTGAPRPLPGGAVFRPRGAA